MTHLPKSADLVLESAAGVEERNYAAGTRRASLSVMLFPSYCSIFSNYWAWMHSSWCERPKWPQNARSGDPVGLGSLP